MRLRSAKIFSQDHFSAEELPYPELIVALKRVASAAPQSQARARIASRCVKMKEEDSMQCDVADEKLSAAILQMTGRMLECSTTKATTF